MFPRLFEFGDFSLPTYGFFTALAYLSGSFYFYRARNRLNLTSEQALDIIFWIFASAVIGAKLFYVFLFWNEMGFSFFDRLFNAVRHARYGFVFYGGFAAALTTLIFICREKKVDFRAAADILSPALALGHFFGRLGCFSAGCCHGKPTDSPLGMIFSNPESLVKPEFLGVPIHPTQLYSAFSNFIIFLILHLSLKIPPQKRPKGLVFSAYLFLYSVSRFTVEFFRGDDRGFFAFFMSVSQIISVLTFLAALLLAGNFVLKHRRNALWTKKK